MWNTFNHYHALIPKLLNILYPSKCPVCGNETDVLSYAPICSPCWLGIKRHNGPSCRVCAIPLVSEYAGVCGQCIKNPPPFSRVIAYGTYEGTLSKAINRLKFYGIKRLSKHLAGLLLSLDLPAMDGIVPVPLSIKGLKERGFNQSLLVARVLSKKLRIPLLMDTLFKMKETPPQIGLSAKDRLLNIKNAFVVKANVKNLRLFLVDDVMTTGATVTECSKVLMKAGAKEVIVLTLARACMM
jgi:ComF family protein